MSDRRPIKVTRKLSYTVYFATIIVKDKKDWGKKDDLLVIQLSQRTCLPCFGETPTKAFSITNGVSSKALLASEFFL